MSRNFAIAFGVGLAVIALAVAGVLFMQRGSAIALDGRILKVRTAPLDENSTVAVIDFRISNPSDIVFQVRQVEVEMVDTKGTPYFGDVISEGDAKRVFEALPVLGTKFLNTLSMQERINSHSTGDHMVAVRFQAPVAQVDARAKLVLRINESDGKSFEFSER